MIAIERIDHVVLTVASIEATCAWYARVLGMEVREFGGRKALHFGRQKINLHAIGAEIEPKAPNAGPGTGDLCLITAAPIEDVLAHLRASGVEVLQGPVTRTGALGPIESVYLRDPDGNLIEISVC
ncbi:MAG TPA: VOC family protein [Herpetosiphonaceae bacterium]|nr:VOC family protein [Herpetosiphonaceae bacterium]